MLQKKLHSLFLPRFDWIQVEVTSFCNASCFYCPHTVYRERWTSRHMPLEMFKRLIPVLKKTKLVYLQGWGEPFLHPDFFSLAALAREAGCSVGTTTNGMNLDSAWVERIIQSRLDILGFSLAHTDSQNDFLRQGTHLEQVLGLIRSVTEAKRKAGTEKPVIHVAYLLLESNKRDARRLPGLLNGLGVHEVVISTLDCVAAPELKKELVELGTEDERERLRDYLKSICAEGERAGLPIHYQIGNCGRKKLYCSENIQKAAVISASGDVFPCVFMNLAPEEPNNAHDQRSAERVCFGNIAQEPLEKIWRSDAYKKFRRSFSRERLAPRCAHCLKLYLDSGGPSSPQQSQSF